MCVFAINRAVSPRWEGSRERFTSFLNPDIRAFHGAIEGYEPSPIIGLPGLARRLGVGEIWVKDESRRFGLQAFKGLGASYAIYRFLASRREITGRNPFAAGNRLPAGKYTFCTATDGNHGRAVAWISRLFQQNAVIYMPSSTVPARIKNIEAEGARVLIVDGTYDRAVARAAEDATKNGWQVIADTAYPGYIEIPDDIMAGYMTMFLEIEEQSSLHDREKPKIDIVILPGGVGSFAAAAAVYYSHRYGDNRPALAVVEPIEAACLLESAVKGDIVSATGTLTTIMAGLNCGTPSLTAWPILKHTIDLFLGISDNFAKAAMRAYYFPEATDPRVISGESGAAALAGLLALMASDSLREAREFLNLSRASRILVINTEGNTDQDAFSRIIADR